ncbi:hypothetical protein SELMODRAFT_135165, partial [Selaginella moellendorffii]
FTNKLTLMFRPAEEMDVLEFSEAESNLNDLVTEYQQYRDASMTTMTLGRIQIHSVKNHSLFSQRQKYYYFFPSQGLGYIFSLGFFYSRCARFRQVWMLLSIKKLWSLAIMSLQRLAAELKRPGMAAITELHTREHQLQLQRIEQRMDTTVLEHLMEATSQRQL